MRMRSFYAQSSLVNNAASAGVNATYLRSTALHHLLEQIQCSHIVSHEVESRVDVEGSVSRRLLPVVHEDHVLIKIQKILEWIAQPHLRHIQRKVAPLPSSERLT